MDYNESTSMPTRDLDICFVLAVVGLTVGLTGIVLSGLPSEQFPRVEPLLLVATFFGDLTTLAWCIHFYVTS